MVGYRLTPRAQIGLRSIIEYVEGRFGVRVAERVLDKLEEAFELVADSPGVGRVREDITSNAQVRFWTVTPSLIAYRVVEDEF